MKYQNKYRIDSARLKNWDYGSSASYFITICTANREHYFGEIIEQKMNLSILGNIVQQEWVKTVQLRPDMNLSLGEFVVMPNHFHAIIFIGDNAYNRGNVNRCDDDGDYRPIDADCHRNDAGIHRNDANRHRRDAMHGVSTTNIGRSTTNNVGMTTDNAGTTTINAGTTTDNGGTTTTGNKFGSQSKNLASIVRGFKSSVTTWARRNDVPFNWQPRYHDHIVRNTTEYYRISNYIINNPANWQEDKFFAR